MLDCLKLWLYNMYINEIDLCFFLNIYGVELLNSKYFRSFSFYHCVMVIILLIYLRSIHLYCVIFFSHFRCDQPIGNIGCKPHERRHCNLIKHIIFRKCVGKLGIRKAKEYLKSCRTDVCVHRTNRNNFKAILCSSIESFAGECAKAGVNVDWRRVAQCRKKLIFILIVFSYFKRIISIFVWLKCLLELLLYKWNWLLFNTGIIMLCINIGYSIPNILTKASHEMTWIWLRIGNERRETFDR